MKRIAAAAATLVLGVTMCTASAQAQERERYTTALRPIAAPSIGAAPQPAASEGALAEFARLRIAASPARSGRESTTASATESMRTIGVTIPRGAKAR